ncbi:MFS general substrate transporter-like protein [Aspergillus brunneoviolaceus CBS 621.78]|uniref:MFS general substrate transporter-like protein n=1 Tax=Aspergillus brunneoviolaceus CBS 621.78 TaxID=1450534 RepID=A0ACD1GDN3_9EURO|nr:MFS general substrate transporter-like protein [Aspergillus brunneoviolaceus CBS 621.78]RAH47378.1 MFS general substrate transporter-like protein [Aspergillus brunneoviolaceus CBS 621.78]
MEPKNSPPESVDAPLAEVLDDAPKLTFNHDLRFWLVFIALCVTSLLAALEGTVTSTALPTIVADLQIGDNYPWVSDAYFLTTAAFQPLYGQFANVFGRRYPMIFSVVLFILGSGICGGASSEAMLIAGRAVQGVGGGGINMLIDLIICDLVPLTQRGAYIGLLFVVFAIGTSLGPFIGGAIVGNTTWRWVFYLNLPIGGLGLGLLILFLQINYNRAMSIGAKLKRLDYLGNLLLVGAIVSILIALSWGGTRYPWSSGHVLAPLIIGLVGSPAFVLYQATPFVEEPTTPLRLFSNRTSIIAFFNTFMHGLLSFWILYMLPVYFQAVLQSSPERSGVQLLPTVISMIPVAGVSGAILSKTSNYKLLHISSTAAWTLTQIIAAFGAGTVMPVLLPAVQAGLEEKDTATSTALWAFVRSFGIIWGLSVPAAIFNNQFDKYASSISDRSVRNMLSGGNAYSYASSATISALPAAVRAETINMHSRSLRVVWQGSIGFSGLSFLLCFFEKNIKLRSHLETEYGLKEKNAGNGSNGTEPAV